MGKVADIIITMPFDNVVLNYLSEFEPLILFVVLPFHSCTPWKLKKAKYVKRCERNLQNMWKNDFSLGRNLLRNFGTQRGYWKACQRAWCGKCYRVEHDDEYPIERLQEEDNFDLTVKEDK